MAKVGQEEEYIGFNVTRFKENWETGFILFVGKSRNVLSALRTVVPCKQINMNKNLKWNTTHFLLLISLQDRLYHE